MNEPQESKAPLASLARTIELRGGQADPEATMVIEHREALIYLLCEAAELEHSIMCEYLFAAFSLKQGSDEGLTEDELSTVKRWRRAISRVASEEMLHLALVHNLLSAIGAAPHLARPNLPQPARHYPAGVQLALMPFGEPALRHFMFLERPEGMQLEDAEAFATAPENAIPLMPEADIVPRLQDFATVGHLYRSIEEGLAHLAAKYGERGLFVGPPKAQASTTDFRWPELVAVTDLRSALKAIDTILEQGEGARGEWQEAHFGQFVKILDEYQQMRKANPGFDPVRPVLVANARPCEHDDSIPLIGDPITAQCADLFNVAYEILLQSLERYFAHTEESDAQLATLADATLGLMLNVLKPLGDLITTLPVGPEHPGMTAGPSFELFYENDYLMPHRGAAWALLEERLRETAEFCERLRAKTGVTESLAAQLAPVGEALDKIADSLAAHFSDWGATSRYSQEPELSKEIPGADLGSLLERATELAAAFPAAWINDDPAGRVAGLFADAHHLFATAAETAGIQGPDSPRLDRVAARLVHSVLRPLSDSLARASAGEAPASQDQAPSRESVVDQDIDAQLWSLALEATRQRADIPTNSRLSAGLAEATACLQGLSIEFAPSEGPLSADVRLAQLRAIQHELGATIQVTADGPYLATNATNVVSALGVRLATTPQMALCRCGRSAIKPLCDGSHARVGFSGAKDPKRIVDLRATYVGQQVTVLDNRGICQHSGFCTDRLATVFHASSEPFVTPSGGRMDEIIRAVRDCPSRVRWVSLLLQSATEAGLPSDPEFAAAFQSYIEWGSRSAVRDSQPDATPQQQMPMQQWNWSSGAGPPDGRVSALVPALKEEPVLLPEANDPVSFERHIGPMFRQSDRQSMKFVFDLGAYEDVQKHADAILERLRDGSMPCDGAWPQERIDAFRRWVNSGKAR